MKLDFLNNMLNKSIDTKKGNSFINNFLAEIKENLIKKQSYEIAKALPWNTILNFAKYDGNFAVCFDYSRKKTYYIPKSSILGTLPQPGEVLKINSPGRFYIDYTGIPAKESNIDNYLKECTIAN